MCVYVYICIVPWFHELNIDAVYEKSKETYLFNLVVYNEPGNLRVETHSFNSLSPFLILSLSFSPSLSLTLILSLTPVSLFLSLSPPSLSPSNIYAQSHDSYSNEGVKFKSNLICFIYLNSVMLASSICYTLSLAFLYASQQTNLKQVELL